MRNRRFTNAGKEKATATQITTIRELAAAKGYTGDTGYKAAQDLLGEGRGWADSPEAAQRLIDALNG